ncbi:flagellar motor protein MotB [Thiocystis minor]|uniref:OmpA family protein n=1 Tax=Thiocystis minor TaxID=61597 RepID=UPI0019140AB2|nr:OmpA family protein [Thiocystis minor]MBK5965732.1 flagellar motor protein MotB [Thiocystis minor]
MLRTILITLSLSLCAAGAWSDATLPTKDLEGTQDNPLLKRYEGSFIVAHDGKAFDEFVLPTGPLKEDTDKERRDQHNNHWFAPEQSLALEGRTTRLVYVVPAGRSPLEIVRNYQDEIEALGGQVLFACKGEACGGDPGRSSSGGGGEMSLAMVLYPEERINDPAFSNGNCALTERIKDQRYLAAELPEQQAHVSVLTYTLKVGSSCKALDGRTVAVVDIVESQGREQKMVKVDAAAMARAIATTGRIALYGILFDFDQAVVKAESAPALTEIAALLTANPDLKLLVVGHTDMAGTFEYNRALSQRRAEAVVTALVRDHDVDNARLLPVGVSFAAPLASNQTEEGRAQNRRVELVQY